MSKIKKLLQDGAEVSEELDKLARPKLSVNGFLREALKVSNLTRSTLKQLNEAVDERQDLESVQAFIRQATKFARENHCPRMPRQVSRIRFMGSESLEGEMGILGSDYFQLFAVSVLRATEESPESFGSVEDWDAMEERCKSLRSKREEIISEIESVYTVSDLEFDEVDNNGRTKATFKISNGEVCLGANAGERLLNWHMSQSNMVAV